MFILGVSEKTSGAGCIGLVALVGVLVAGLVEDKGASPEPELEGVGLLALALPLPFPELTVLGLAVPVGASGLKRVGGCGFESTLYVNPTVAIAGVKEEEKV